MEAKQGSAGKSQQTKNSSKRNQKKSATENKNQQNNIDLSKNSKLQKSKGGGGGGSGGGVPKQGSKPLSAVPPKKTQDKGVISQSVNKGDTNKEESKKQNKRKNKKSDFVPKGGTFTKKGDSAQLKTEKEGTDTTKGPLDRKKEQLIVSQNRNVSKEDKSKSPSEEAILKSGSELSKSKKRRIRKKRVLESLGIIVNTVKSVKDKTSAKKRKKKKRGKFSVNESVAVEPPQNSNTIVKSQNVGEINVPVSSKVEQKSGDVEVKKTSAKKTENAVNFSTKPKDTNNSHPKNSQKSSEQVLQKKETKIEKKIQAVDKLELKESNNPTENPAAIKICSECEDLSFTEQDRELSPVENGSSPEDISLEFLGNKDEPQPSGRVDLVNILSHENVEGLFRSALLNDITLSSRCSEKEVKNFFNTYGTFSERGRTQFAAVEKLLHASCKGNEDLVKSQYFEPSLDKELSPSLTAQTSAVLNRESSAESNASALAVIPSPNCEYFSAKHIKDNVNAIEPVSASNITHTESSCNQVIKSNRVDSVGNSLVLKGGLCRGPIYTSPNLENRVTSSASSTQVQNSSSRVFVPNAYETCNVKEQDKLFDPCKVPQLENPEPKLVDNDVLVHDKVKEQFLPEENKKFSDVSNVSKPNLPVNVRTCTVNTGVDNLARKRVQSYENNADVNRVECCANFAHVSNEVAACREEKINKECKINVEESYCPVNTDPPKAQLTVSSRQDKNRCENISEKSEKKSDQGKQKWNGFPSDNPEKSYDVGRATESAVSLRKEEENKTTKDCSVSHVTDVSFIDHNKNNESCGTDFLTDPNKNKTKPKISNKPVTTPVYDSGTEVSTNQDLDICETNCIPSLEDKDIMKPTRGKPAESSNPQKTGKSREEILAEREAKKAAKVAAKKKDKGPATSNATTKLVEEAIVSPEKQTASSPSKHSQQLKASTVADKNKTEPCTVSLTDDAKLNKASSANTNQVPDVESIPSPLRESGQEKPEVKNRPLRESGQEKPEVKNQLPAQGTRVIEKTKIQKVLIPDMKGNDPEKLTGMTGEKVVKTDCAKGDTSQITGKTEIPATKSKAELRAERRAIQEAQRAAKIAQQQGKLAPAKSVAPVDSKGKLPPKTDVQETPKKSVKTVQPIKPKTHEHRVKLFNHLYQEKGPFSETLMKYGPVVHPAIVRVGIQSAGRVVVGSNARCIALLYALKEVIKDYETPPHKEFSRGLEGALKPSVTFLYRCRPLSVSMTNALRHIRRQLTQLPNNVADVEAKKKLLETIDTYIREQIDMAAQAICIMVQRKIANGDVILTYGCSSLLQRIFLEAHRSGTKFKVVIVDGRPWKEGQEMLRRLVEHGLDCSYVLVSAASFIMREVTKVFLGAHALLANGYVMSRAGASQVALVAHSYNVPVLVCCETHKFSERVQTDSFVYNELGNPDDLIPTESCSKERPLSKWRTIGSLTPLNLTYDVTPPDLVTAVVTELGILPCTSVPVVLRIKPSETGS